AQLFRVNDQHTQQEFVVPQPRSPTRTNVADEVTSIGMDVRLGGATTTVTGLEAGHGNGNIDKTSTMPYNSPLLRVHTLGSDEGIMQHNELMDLVTKLLDRVVALETDLMQTKKVYGAAFTKLIKKVKRDYFGIDGRFSASTDFTTANVPVTTAGAEISTASPEVITAGDFVDDIAAESLVYIRRSAAKTKDKALRLQEKLDEEERQRNARAHKAASSLNIEEWEDIQARIEADEELLAELINQRKRHFAQQRAKERRNKPPIQAQQRTYMSNYIKHMGSYTLQQLRGYSFNEIKNLFEATMKRVNTFTPMESDVDRTVPKIAAGSSKRDVEEELGQESSKRQKISESSQQAKEPRDKESDELSQEELQQLMIIVPEEGMNIEALQTKYPN
ncbi:hypothetical protein Tco_0768305, partial [Tanacetum coccineum]